MKKRKSKKLRKNVKNFLILTIFVILASYAGWFLQRNESLNKQKVVINYETVDTKKTTKVSMAMVGDALIHGTVYLTANRYANYNGYKKKYIHTPRNQLFLEYLRYVDYFRPEIFVIENVPNFITKYKGKIFNTAVEIIENIGKDDEGNGEGIYEVVKPVQVVNAVYYGVPQTRRRMMLVAHKKSNKVFEYPKPTHYYDQEDEESKKLKPCNTVEDAIGDLPTITDNWRISEMPYSKTEGLTEYQQLMQSYGNGKTIKNNICRMSNDRAKRVFPYMAQGSKYMDLPPEIRQILPFREDIFKDRLKRLVMKEPSWTVIAHIGMDGYMYIHPTENRTLSVREAARIQSFPDDFEFVGNQQETYVQVGNAVPPLLGKAIGESIKQYLEG